MSRHKAHKLRLTSEYVSLPEAITCKDHKEFGKINNVFCVDIDSDQLFLNLNFKRGQQAIVASKTLVSTRNLS